jgi:MoaA/NifB/PqqE/SkfB family radical SAM enzyme
MKWLAFHITDRCQLNCDHCLRDPDLNTAQLDAKFIGDVVRQGQENLGISHVSLTGGEPTIHPEFYEIIDAINDLGCDWHMVSNGWNFPKIVQRLRSKPARWDTLTCLNISLDGATEETHDSIRGEGSYRHVMQAATMCQALEKPFLFQMVVNQRNVHEIDDLAMLASQMGAIRVYYAFAQPTGTFLDRTLYLSLPEWNLIRDKVVQLNDSFKMEIFGTEGFPSPNVFDPCSVFKHEVMHIDMYGRMNLCCQHAGVPGKAEMEGCFGDLHEVPLVDAYKLMLDHIAKVMKMRVDAISKKELDDEWDSSLCNWCLKCHGKPHWSKDGVGGPKAQRQRWRGAWSPGYKESHLEAGFRVAPEKDNADPK